MAQLLLVGNFLVTRQASPGRLSALEDILFKSGSTGAGPFDAAAGVLAATAAAAEVPVLASVWSGSSEGQRVVGVAFYNSATK